jgi:hypothetical protein
MAISLVQRCINTGNKMFEKSVTLMLASLLGMDQFSSSHLFENIPVFALRKSVLADADDGNVAPRDDPGEDGEEEVEGDNALEDSIRRAAQESANATADANVLPADLVAAGAQAVPTTVETVFVDREAKTVAFVHVTTDYLHRSEKLKIYNFILCSLRRKQEG